MDGLTDTFWVGGDLSGLVPLVEQSVGGFEPIGQDYTPKKRPTRWDKSLVLRLCLFTKVKH